MGKTREVLPGEPVSEFILGKADVDRIFTLNLQAWEAHVKTMSLPDNWNSTLQRHTTGTGIVAIDRQTGSMLGITPTYPDDHNPPVRLTITMANPIGTREDEEGDPFARPGKFVIELRDAILAQIGETYTVSVANTSAEPSEIIEMSVVKRG
jgi:hypothetical protein